MRNYKQKMFRYRLDKARYRELRDYCLCAGRDERMIIESAAADAADEVIGRYILQHVLSTDRSVVALRADGMPCNDDTFRVYRARFFWILDQRLRLIGE